MNTVFATLVRLFGLLLLLGAGSAYAQDYPSRAIHIVVPSQPGGSTDLLARAFAKSLQEIAGVPTVVENRGGAGGAIGVAAVAKAQPDGYTLLVTPPDAVVVLPHQKTSGLGYDVQKQLTPVAMLAETHFTFAVGATSPYQTLADVIEAARKRAGAIKYAGSGLGSATHLVAELLQKRAGVRFLTVHYKGASPATVSVVSGETDATISSPATFKRFIKGGQLRALAISTKGRSAVLPDVPSLTETGYEGFEMTAWFGLFAPAQLPEEVAAKLDSLVSRAQSSFELRGQITTLDLESRAMNMSEFGAFFAEDFGRWKAIIDDSGIDFGN